MNKSIESREAGDKTKGFRLQKLRAVKLALNEINKNTEIHLFFSVELFGDVYIYKDDLNEASEFSEEDKNYDPCKAFTLNNSEIRNSLVIFLSVWKEKRLSKNLRFSFYTSAGIGKEYKVGTLKNIEIPVNGILKNISERKYSEENSLSIAKRIIIEEAKMQNLLDLASLCEKFDDSKWISFFDLITWNFSQSSEVALEKEVIELIKKSSFYNIDFHSGFESYILKHILDDLDGKQSRTDFYERTMSGADIHVIYLKAERGELKGTDPFYEYFENYQVNDLRNIEEKINSINSSFPSKKIKALNRKIVLSKSEQRSFKGDRSLNSLQCRIFDICEDHIARIEKDALNDEEIDNEFEAMADKVKEKLKELSIDYKYPLTNRESIKHLIYDLFDRCYLSFDEPEITGTEVNA
jgi:hypothetical protein